MSNPEQKLKKAFHDHKLLLTSIVGCIINKHFFSKFRIKCNLLQIQFHLRYGPKLGHYSKNNFPSQ